jgi:hypothetical protein
LGAVAACYVVEQAGTQEHSYTPGQFVERYRQAFGDASGIENVVGAPAATLG